MEVPSEDVDPAAIVSAIDRDEVWLVRPRIETNEAAETATGVVVAGHSLQSAEASSSVNGQQRVEGAANRINGGNSIDRRSPGVPDRSAARAIIVVGLAEFFGSVRIIALNGALKWAESWRGQRHGVGYVIAAWIEKNVLAKEWN